MENNPARYADDDVADDDFDYEEARPRSSSRLMRVIVSLLRIHTEIARRELAQDQGRLVRALVLLMVGGLLVATVLVLMQVIGVAVLQAHGLRLWAAVLTMAGVDAGLGGLLLVLGARALRQPLMPETRSLLRRTLGAIIAP